MTSCLVPSVGGALTEQKEKLVGDNDGTAVKQDYADGRPTGPRS